MPKPIPTMQYIDLLRQHDPIEDVHGHANAAQKDVMLTVIAREVEYLCGERYAHDDQHGGRFKRWGFNDGSIKIRSERVPIRVPRVRDTETNRMHSLASYRKLRRPTKKLQKKLAEKVFLGIHLRDYDRVSREFAESYGLSASTVSRAFQEYSAQVLREMEARDLSQDTYVVLMFDATKIQNKHILICTGVTVAGTKQFLGFVELSTENAEAITGFLMKLLDQGLRYAHGLLCVMDGAKGIKKAVQEVFGDYAQIQRCMWHKRENVVGKLQRKEDQGPLRKAFNKAYNQETYAEAKQALDEILQGLEMEGQQAAANSLREGMEETLTLHKLGVGKELQQSLRTTNMMENINRTIKERLARIRRWVDSDQCHRWVAMALVFAEEGLTKIEQPDQLAALQKALLEQIPKTELLSMEET